MITPSTYLSKVQQDTSRLERKLEDYLASPTADNVHDVRTAVRRMDATMRLLPKKIRNKKRLAKYTGKYKKLFKLNTKIRDFDIVLSKLTKFPSTPRYSQLLKKITKQRETQLTFARGAALSLQKTTVPKIEPLLPKESKLQSRFDKKLRKADTKITRMVPLLLKNGGGDPDELHTLRKYCKELRYSLELDPSSEESSRLIGVLKEWQDYLGAIHDGDITVACLRKVKDSFPVKHIMDEEISERKQKLESFVETCREQFSGDKKATFITAST